MFVKTENKTKRNIWKADYKVNPENPQIKLLNLFDHISSDTVILDDAEYSFCKNYISKFPSLQNAVLNLYYYKKQYNTNIQKSIIVSAVRLSEEELCTLCRIFTNAVFDENYPVFDNQDHICDSMQSVQVIGLTAVGCEIAESIINENPLLSEIYNKPIVSDIKNTSFYCFESDSQAIAEQKYADYVDFLFSEDYFKACGILNVSAFTFEKLKNHPLCNEINKRVNKLYLLNYDLELNGKLYYVKYLNWY